MDNTYQYEFYISKDEGKTLHQVACGTSFTSMCKCIFFYDVKLHYIKTPTMKKPTLFTKEEAYTIFGDDLNSTFSYTEVENVNMERKYKLSKL